MWKQIDFHTHILPGMDDGSQNAEESFIMLEMMKAQGIDAIVASPHFYPGQNFEHFFEKRQRSIEEFLRVYSAEEHPKIYVGAEVAFFPGIGKSQDVKKLCILGTRYLLLEMPFERWSNEVVNEVLALKENDITPIIVHVERYTKFLKKKQLFHLINDGVFIQSNAAFFCDRKTQRKSLRMLRSGEIHLLGSDCHNTTERPPNLKGAMDVIFDRLGEAYLSEIQQISNDVLGKAMRLEEL